jgi:hypothetical protein
MKSVSRNPLYTVTDLTVPETITELKKKTGIHGRGRDVSCLTRPA